MTTTTARAFLPVTLALSLAHSAEAALAVGNLGATPTDPWILGSGSDLVDSPVANSFTTGSGPGWTLDSIVANVGVSFGTPVGSLNVYLAADASGAPGTQLVGLSGANPSTSSETVSYAPISTFTLNSGTTYWLVISANVSDNYHWFYTDDTTQTGLSGWSIGDTSYAGYPSGDWTALENPFSVPENGPAPVLFEVNATAVPEPGATILAGLAGLAFLRRRRQS